LETRSRVKDGHLIKHKYKVTGTTVDIEWPSDIRVSKQDIRMEMDVVSDANIPSFDTINYKMTDQPPPHWEKDAEKALEWLGLAQLKAKRLCRLDKREPFVSVYNSPAPFLDNQQTCVMLKWKGFIPSPIIQSIMVDIR
jgi:hypothetical protein